MTNWVVFVPRDSTVANKVDVDQKPSLIDQAKAWVAHSGGKLSDSDVVCIGDTFPATRLAGPDSTLYIMGGHGKEGRNYVSWPGESNPLCSHQMGDAIQTAGLPTSFAGKLKVYSCLSADGKGASAVAFAKLFGQYMAHLGYRSCTVWGYTGAVSKGYVNSGTSLAPLGMVDRLKFKQTAELNQGHHRYATVTGGYGGRAGAAKVDFTVKPSVTPTIGACTVCGRT